MNYLIAGFSGAGKTYLLEEIKREKAASCFEKKDLDHEIAKSLGVAEHLLGEWIRKNGFEKFRNVEKQILENLLEKDQQIIALGGGSLTPEFLERLASDQSIKAFYLNTSFDVCWSRIAQDANRPLVQKGREMVEEIYQERIKLLNNLTKIEDLADFLQFACLSE